MTRELFDGKRSREASVVGQASGAEVVILGFDAVLLGAVHVDGEVEVLLEMPPRLVGCPECGVVR